VEGDLGALTALTEDSIVVGKIKIAADCPDEPDPRHHAVR